MGDYKICSLKQSYRDDSNVPVEPKKPIELQKPVEPLNEGANGVRYYPLHRDND